MACKLPTVGGNYLEGKIIMLCVPLFYTPKTLEAVAEKVGINEQLLNVGIDKLLCLKFHENSKQLGVPVCKHNKDKVNGCITRGMKCLNVGSKK